MVNGTAISGKSDKGGSANAPNAPETKAIPRLRQPQERMISSISESTTLALGMMAESATPKESPLVTGRIVIVHHSGDPACSTCRRLQGNEPIRVSLGGASLERGRLEASERWKKPHPRRSIRRLRQPPFARRDAVPAKLP